MCSAQAGDSTWPVPPAAANLSAAAAAAGSSTGRCSPSRGPAQCANSSDRCGTQSLCRMEWLLQTAQAALHYCTPRTNPESERWALAAGTDSNACSFDLCRNYKGCKRVQGGPPPRQHQSDTMIASAGKGRLKTKERTCTWSASCRASCRGAGCWCRRAGASGARCRVGKGSSASAPAAFAAATMATAAFRASTSADRRASRTSRPLIRSDRLLALRQHKRKWCRRRHESK